MKNLKSFFEPKSIVIIGASNHFEKVGGILLKKALKSKAKIIPINPKHEKLLGVKCYPSVLDYKNNIELAVIAIPAPLVEATIEECGKKKIKNIILITAGFAEIGNTQAEEKILEIAKKYRIRILGPNCFGIMHNNLDLTFSASSPKKGTIGFISQSGALWSFLADLSLTKDFGFSEFISLGDMADLEFSDFLEYLIEDKKTKAILLYIEKIKNGKKFIDICKKSKKPIYVVKAGTSKEGSRAAFSHTASLASDYEIYRGAFKQAKVILCASPEEAIEKIINKKITKKENQEIKLGKNSFIITNAGGAGALVSDYIMEKNFILKDKSLDILGTATANDYLINLEKIKQIQGLETIFCILTPQTMTEIEKTAEVLVAFSKNNPEIKVIPIFLGGKVIIPANKIFIKAGLDYFNTLEDLRQTNFIF
jgi:acetyltransferase